MAVRETINERYPQYKVGKGTYGVPHVRARDDGATLEIGAYTSIATDFKFYLVVSIEWIG